MEQKTDSNIQKDNEYFSDEIDLFDLFRKIWKWKWLTIAIVVIATVLTFIYVKMKPDTYTSYAIVKVGIIAGQGIDALNLNSPTVVSILKKIETKYSKKMTVIKNKPIIFFNGEKGEIIYSNSQFSFFIEPFSSFYSINITSQKAELSLEVVDFFVKALLDEHKRIYIDGIEKLKNNINYFKKKEAVENGVYFSVPYLLDTYNYQSEIITDPKLPDGPDSKKMTVKLAVAFMASFFVGIFLSFVIEFFLAHKREQANSEK